MRLAAILLQQALALAVFVGMPALFTAMAPVSWVVFQRHEGRVAARVQTCLLFFVPYDTQSIEPVVAIGNRFVEGTSTTPDPRITTDPATKTEDAGFLVIRGPDRAIELPVSPVSIPSALDRAEAFLDDPAATELHMFVVANWKASVLFGGLASLLTVLFIVGVAWGLAIRAIDAFRSSRGARPE